MDKAIEALNAHEESRQLMRLAQAQDEFLMRYSELIDSDRRKEDFRRDLIYLIHLAYREAQIPLVKQLTDIVVGSNQPLVWFPKGKS